MCDVALRVIRSRRIEAFGCRFRVICAFHFVDLLDRAGDGTVPSMVILWAEECLVDRTVDKFIDKQTVEHVPQRIRLRLEPKLVTFLHVCADGKWSGFTGADDYTIIIRLGDRPSTRFELPDEKIVPGFEAKIRSFGIVNEIVHLQCF